MAQNEKHMAQNEKHTAPNEEHKREEPSEIPWEVPSTRVDDCLHTPPHRLAAWEGIKMKNLPTPKV